MPAAPGGTGGRGGAPGAPPGAIGNKALGVPGPVTSTRAMRGVTGIFAAPGLPTGGPANYTVTNGRIVQSS